MKRCLALLIAALVFSSAPALAQQDTIIGRGGSPVRGTIVGISPTVVKIETTGAARDIETRDIQKLSFGDEPADVTSARDQAIAGWPISSRSVTRPSRGWSRGPAGTSSTTCSARVRPTTRHSWGPERARARKRS